jgi:DNA-binding beta-propeller fold protein YncE
MRVTLAAAAAALATIVIVAAAALLAGVIGGERAVPSRPATPRVLATVSVGQNPYALVAAFGAAWVFDRSDGMLLRVDPNTRKVTARVPVGQDVLVGSGPDAVYAAERGSGTVTRIDPRDARATTHRRFGTANAVLPLTDKGRLWAVGVDGATRLDPATLATRATVALRGGFKATGWGLTGGDLWALQADGRLHHFDSATGAPRSLGHAPRGLAYLFSAGGAIFGVGDGQFMRLDARSGAVLWRSPVAGEVGPAAVQRGAVWVHVSDPARGADRLAGFDVATGRPVGATSLPEFGAAGLARVGGQLWLTTPGGEVLVLGW